MLTTESLEKFGADTKEGINRCFGDKDLYFTMIMKVMEDNSFINLKYALLNYDLKKSFELAVSLRDVFNNLALVPLYELCNELCELIKKKNKDYKDILDKLFKKRDELINLL